MTWQSQNCRNYACSEYETSSYGQLSYHVAALVNAKLYGNNSTLKVISGN